MQSRKFYYIFAIVLLMLCIFVWYKVLTFHKRELTVAFLDIGQGDSIYIESPSGNQVLVDGGPTTNKVLSELGKVMSLGDTSIDLLIATHPDADHVGGLPAVLDRYEVSAVMEPGVIQPKPTQIYQTFEQKVETEGAQKILARRGQKVDLGDGVVLSILYPDRDVSHVKNTNDGSIVARLDYGADCFLLTGDAPILVEQIILGYKENIECEVLKAGHHGSRTSTSASFLGAVHPIYTIISAGKNNRYGHPHKEVIDLLNRASTTMISTIDHSTIIFRIDSAGLHIK